MTSLIATTAPTRGAIACACFSEWHVFKTTRDGAFDCGRSKILAKAVGETYSTWPPRSSINDWFDGFTPGDNTWTTSGRCSFNRRISPSALTDQRAVSVKLPPA